VTNAHAIAPVAIHGWSPSTYILLFIAILNTGAVGAWIKARGGWMKNETDADAVLRGEMWKDIAALKAAKDDQSRRLTVAETKIASQTVEIGQLRFVSKLLVNEIERLDPKNVIASQARVLLDTVQPMALPSDVEIASMAETVTKMECGE
jgi:hypothetical protein